MPRAFVVVIVYEAKTTSGPGHHISVLGEVHIEKWGTVLTSDLLGSPVDTTFGGTTDPSSDG